MSVNVRVRRPASMSVTGRAKVSYCQPNGSCQRVEMNIVDGHGVFMPHIDLDTATSSDTLAVTVTVVEYKTGITEMSTVHLLIFLEHLHIHVDNVPAQFTNGSHLRVPVSVTRADNSPATQECLRFKISTASSPSTLLYSRDQRSDSRGEAVAFWDIPSTLSQDLKIQVNGCDGEATPIELTVAYSPHRVMSLDTHRHRYVVGDVIRVNITDSQPDHQLLVRRCAGDILDVMSIQTEHMLIHVTALMYPCLVLSMVQWALSENNSILSSLTIDIDNPLNYQLESDRGEYSLGTQATVSLTPNLPVDSRLLLLAAGSKNSDSTFPTSRLTAERDVKVVATETSACSRQLSTYRCNSSLTTVSSNNSSTTVSPHNPLHSANQSSSSLHRLRHQRSRSRSRPQSEVTPSVVEETTSPLPQRDWLPDRAAYRALGLPDHWLGRNKRSVSSCITYLSVGRTQLLPWCQQQEVKLRLPQYEPSDWLLTGLLVTSRYGMQPLSTLTLRSVAVAHLVIKSPPSQLVEGEQFQLHITVMSYNITHRLHAHVRLILSEEEAFCFGDLLLNSYPHVNVTLDSHSEHAAASFTATSLLEGNFSVAIELWVNELKIGQEDIQLTVARPASNVSEIFPTSANPLADWSTPPFPSMNSGNLELKMRYNQQSNQQRCKGFRLKINHEIYEEPAQPAPSSSFADFLGRRRRSVATHLISSVPRHSLLICYKILQRSAQGSYYIDVESFAGYRAPLELSTNVNCTVRVQNMQAYDRGTIIMIENSVSNDSWCCLNMLLESSSPDTNVMHTQFNQSASVRMHDVNRPGDFCLEFYNLHARSPYSNHICSQHGCLCTESTLGTCKRLKSSSMRRTMLTITRQFLEAKHKFEVTPSGQGQTLENGLQAQLVTVLNSYGASHIAAGQHLLLYYKQRKKKCLLFASNSTFIVIGRQLHIQADDSRLSYMYLEQQSSVINTEELKSRNKILSCFLSMLFCPISSALNFSHLFINSTAESISTSIHSTCRYRQSLVTNGAYETYASRYDLDDFTCQPDLGHVFHLQSTYQSIRRRRRRHRRRKFMNEFLSR